MSWHMVTFSDIASLRASLQFLAFSEAYLYSAAQLCDVLCHSPERSSYPKGAVVLSLTFHGVELFLKAAILEKCPDEQFGGLTGHDVEHLGKRYANLYPGKKYTFEAPFKSEEPDLTGLDPRVAEALKADINELKRLTPTDQLHRYPRDVEGQPWKGCFGFEPNSFLRVITQVREDVTRLKELVFHG